MMSSLAKLADNLKESDFNELRNEFPEQDYFNLVRRKGQFPYDFFDNLNRLKETEFPLRSDFYNKLNDEEIAEVEYEHAKNVWEHFKQKETDSSKFTFGSYHDLYLKQDVLLLADVFEKFRRTCMDYYKLDPAHYYTAPGFAWDAMLKKTGVELELLPDKDMHLLLQNPNGGISMVTHRHAIANNKYFPGYDPSKRSTYLMYFDANSLYSGAMTRYLPISNFRWLTEQEWNEINWENLSDESEVGYIAEVDLEYPKEYHDRDNHSPLAPERMHIIPDIYSQFQRNNFPEEEAKI